MPHRISLSRSENSSPETLINEKRDNFKSKGKEKEMPWNSEKNSPETENHNRRKEKRVFKLKGKGRKGRKEKRDNKFGKELDQWSRTGDKKLEAHEAEENQFSTESDNHRTQFLEHFDVLLAEHIFEEAIDAIDAEEWNHTDQKDRSSFESALSKRKTILENQLIEISQQPSVGILELKKVLSGLLKLGKGPLAHQIFLKSHGARLQRSIEDFLALCPCYPETYSATLSNLVFSAISLATKESGLMFGDNPVYSNRIVQWSEWEIKSLIRLVEENAPPFETSSALRAASVCYEASLYHCSALEAQELKLTKLLFVLLQPFVEEVLELNFRRARKVVLDLDGGGDEIMPLSPRIASPLSTFATRLDCVLVDCGMRFIFVVEEIVEQLTGLVILHFGGNILTRIALLFDKYVEILIKSITGPTEDDNLTELKEPFPFNAETVSQQLALLGTAFTIAEELLPMVVSQKWAVRHETKDVNVGLADKKLSPDNFFDDPKDWRHQLNHSLNKLIDHFCVCFLSFICSRDGETRLDAQIYLVRKGKDLICNADPLPSLPFQALFGKLQQLAAVAGDVLLGRDSIQKAILARLTETVVRWLSHDQEFWGVLEHDSAPLRPLGLQQLVLDMHFTVEIARFAGCRSSMVRKKSSGIITRAVRAFSARGIDPQSSLPEDEWFVETAKGAINKLLSGSGSDEQENKRGPQAEPKDEFENKQGFADFLRGVAGGSESCTICGDAHFHFLCVLQHCCPIEREVGEGFIVVCVCNTVVIDGKCPKNCGSTWGRVRHEQTPFGPFTISCFS